MGSVRAGEAMRLWLAASHPSRYAGLERMNGRVWRVVAFDLPDEVRAGWATASGW